MKKVLSVIIVIILAAVSAAAVFAGKSSVDITKYSPSEEPSAVIVSYYCDEFSRGFSWQTSEDNEETLLYIAEGKHTSDDTDAFDVPAETGSCYCAESYGRKTNIHSAHTENLKPDTDYSYKIGGEGHFAYGTFRTAPADAGKITVLSLTDSQTREASLLYYFEETLKNAVGRIGGADNIDFVSFGGDLYDGNMQDTDIFGNTISCYLRYGASAQLISDYLPSVPFLAVSGNHEREENIVSSSIVADYAGKTNSGGYYSFDCGCAHFVFIPYATDGEMIDKITVWLKDDLTKANENTETKWNIVTMHHGPYTTGDHGAVDSETVVEYYAPVFSKYHVDLVIQGHDHTFSKTLPYLWDTKGYTFRSEDTKTVNFCPDTIEYNSERYDFASDGTYYVSPGCCGHRIGENTDYACEIKVTERVYKTQIDSVDVSSSYFEAGDYASADLDTPMYGVLTADEDTLEYDFYAMNYVTGEDGMYPAEISDREFDGTSTLVDTLRIFKDDGFHTENGEKKEHTFRETADERFLKSPESCTSGRVYFKSCACGTPSRETFEVGNPAPHSYFKGKCTVCGAKDPDYKISNPFGDVKEKDFYYDSVLWAFDNGITSGTTETEFAPKAFCTRGQIVTFLWRAAGQPEVSGNKAKFSDIREKDYYYKAVLWAVKNGITKGTSDTTFEPNTVCTRGQTVTFLYRAKGSPKATADISKFRDVKAKEYYASAVSWAVENDITQGMTQNTFEPGSKCTRGQIVTFLCRAYN